MAKKLVIIDGNAILHRSFHALPPLTTKSGEPINAVYGLVSMILKLIQDVKPDGIVVAFDEKEKTFRQKEYPKYQAQRPPTHDDLSSQFEKARDFLKAAKIPVYSKAGYEGDDVIGTIADKADNFNEKIVVTGDRDLLQLVDDAKNVKLYMPIVGLSNAKFFSSKETIERMGVPPVQIPDLKGLTGDPSDNYPGVTGIGPKTASTLLEKYGSIEEIYKHLDEISGSVKEKLINGKKDAETSLRLAIVLKDVPIKVDYENMENWNIASPDVLKLFEEFGFKTLTERTKKINKEIESEKQGNLF